VKARPARIDITIRYVAILVPLLLVFAVALEVWFRGELEEALQEGLAREADLVLTVAHNEAERPLGPPPGAPRVEGTAPVSTDRVVDRTILARRLTRELAVIGHATRVTDAQGLLARTPATDKLKVADEVLDEKREGLRVKRTGPSKLGDLTVEIASDSEETQETIGEFRLSVVGALVITLLLAGGGGYYLAAQALRPVDEIARTAARIDAGSLGVRVPARPVDDELGRLVGTLNGMLERIEQGVGAVRRFTQDASHELKTPLAAIRGTVDVALLAPRVAADDEKALHAIARECERLERIVKDLLTIARADAGGVVERKEPLDVRAVAAEVAEVGEILAQERGARLVADVAGPPLQIVGDLARLRQVGLNLVDNAIRYGKAGGQVWLRVASDGERALVIVEDDGPGIPAAERERVFERFHRGRRDVPGVGLGLAIARAIVREHGGTIVAGERAGGGARFEVSLPLAR